VELNIIAGTAEILFWLSVGYRYGPGRPPSHVQHDPPLLMRGAGLHRLDHQVPRRRVNELGDIKIDDPVLFPSTARGISPPLPAPRVAVGVIVEDGLVFGSSASAATVCATLSATVGMESASANPQARPAREYGLIGQRAV
jgi:hypothetical protein